MRVGGGGEDRGGRCTPFHSFLFTEFHSYYKNLNYSRQASRTRVSRNIWVSVSGTGKMVDKIHFSCHEPFV